jgi:hypothetical protein
MSIRSALFILGILVGGAVLFVIGAFATIMMLTAPRCGGSSYLCDPTPDADRAPTKRVGAR